MSQAPPKPVCAALPHINHIRAKLEADNWGLRELSRSDAMLVAGFAVFVVLTATVARVLPGHGEEVIVFTSPWAPDGSAIAVAARAGGKIVAGTAMPWAVVVRSDRKDFVSRLYRSGAAFVADPAAAWACGGLVKANRLKGNSGEPA